MQAQFKLTDGMKIKGHYVNEFFIKIKIIWQFCVAPIQIPTVFSTNICIWHDRVKIFVDIWRPIIELKQYKFSIEFEFGWKNS